MFVSGFMLGITVSVFSRVDRSISVLTAHEREKAVKLNILETWRLE